MYQWVALLFLALALPAAACRPFGSYEFAEDAAGGIWFTEGDNNAISRLAPDGKVVSHPLPTPAAEPSSLALDRQGNVWFAEMQGRKIGRLGKDGRIVEFPVVGGHPFQVAIDRQGDAWFTQQADHQTDQQAAPGGDHGSHVSGTGVGRIDRQGRLHFHPTPAGWATSIAFDQRDQAWVSILISHGDQAQPTGQVARLSRDGQWQIETTRENSCPRNLHADGQGRLHYTDGCRHSAGYRSAGGKWVEWQLPEGTSIQQTSLAKDGTIWFTDRKHLARLVGSGKVGLVGRADNGDATMAVLALRNGDVVFSEFYNYNVNRLKKSGELVEHLVAVDERKSAREVKEGEICRIEFGARIAAKAEMDKRRAEEVRQGRFKPDGTGTEKLVEQKCQVCHDARRLLLSRRSDWTPSITRMHDYRKLRGVEPLTAEETTRLVRYFNDYYGLAR